MCPLDDQDLGIREIHFFIPQFGIFSSHPFQPDLFCLVFKAFNDFFHFFEIDFIQGTKISSQACLTILQIRFIPVVALFQLRICIHSCNLSFMDDVESFFCKCSVFYHTADRTLTKYMKTFCIVVLWNSVRIVISGQCIGFHANLIKIERKQRSGL